MGASSFDDQEERDAQRQFKEKRFWCLVRSGHTGEKSWRWASPRGWEWTEDGDGRYCSVLADDEILEMVETEFIDDLDYSFMLEGFPDDWTCGWLSPSARFYPSRSWEHDRVAWLVLHYDGCSGQNAMEEKGWARLWGAWDNPEFSNERRLSAEQRNWMSRMGFCLADYD